MRDKILISFLRFRSRHICYFVFELISVISKLTQWKGKWITCLLSGFPGW